MLSHERLLEVLEYMPDTGCFIRRSTSKVAGSIMTGGYRRVRIDGKVYLCHRLAWFYVYGIWPTHEIDHRNGNPGDNRIDNLRCATHSQNSQNKCHSNNRSGHPGAKWIASRNKWSARVKINGRCVHVGLFETAKEASNAYMEKKRELHPFFNK